MAKPTLLSPSPLCIRCLRIALLPSQTPLSDKRRRISTYGYTQAKALVYSEHGNPSDALRLHKHSLPPPHSTLLTLRALAAPLNPADINQIQGFYPTPPKDRHFTTALGTASPSAIPGNEGVFEVVALGGQAGKGNVGNGEEGLQKGDWVIPRRTGLGTWRTHAQVDESAVLRIEKEGVSASQVGSVSVNPVTAWRLLSGFVDWGVEFAKLAGGGGGGAGGGGPWYIQNGANSAVGRVASQLGKLWGLRGIAVVREREDKGEEEALKAEMRALGAEKVVTDKEVGEKGFRERIAEWTNGGREEVRLGLNCVGGDAAMNMAKVLGKGGTMVTYGAMSKAPMRVGASMLIFKDLRFVGFWVSHWADEHPGEKRKVVDSVLDLYREGKLVESPTLDVRWNEETKQEELVQAVQGTLEGYRKGKGMFIFGE
ncbi:uncharacterized protein KY384_005596 [Bacidia gigantensis]|uniref:uncharacterized protein n=1 Tax=Bacidia gigantensis TaxID=2732470 RepID=UPI001D03FBD2|nr:uncharacterized protein KY384_005596 [Bacidia gigantensis]KAG8530114.1 hypothetical protein KY384_005596 [Bacidia gigantensis]